MTNKKQSQPSVSDSREGRDKLATSATPSTEFLDACAARDISAEDRLPLWTLHHTWRRPSTDEQERLDELFEDYEHWRCFQASRAGDPRAAGEFDRQWRGYARAYLSRRFRPDMVDEVTSRFFVRVYRLLPERFHFRCPFTAYLRAMLVNLSRDLGRAVGVSLKREVSLDNDEVGAPVRSLHARQKSPEQAALEAEVRERVHRALGGLAPGDRHILRVCQLEDGSGNELADELGITANALYQRLSRAKKRLRKALSEDGTAELLQPRAGRAGFVTMERSLAAERSAPQPTV